MRTYLDCYPCFIRQALEAARYAGADEEKQRFVLERAMDALKAIPIGATPPVVGDVIHNIVRQEVDGGDPYKEIKACGTRQALSLYPRLKRLVAESDDPLDLAVRLAIAGNVIDAGLAVEYDLWDTIEKTISQPFALDDGRALRDALEGAQSVLYLADNAGETVFDRVLIETMGKSVLYAVKGGPILNDATVEDALAAGLAEVADVVSTGSNAPGTLLGRCSPAFLGVYHEAEVIIAKGQANYETLSDEKGPIFFLLKAKCPVIARDLGVSTGSIVLTQGQWVNRF